MFESREDLAAPLKVTQRGCLGLCGQGPNALVETKEGSRAVNRLDSFKKVMSLLEKVKKSQGLEAAEGRRAHLAQLKSDAMRLLSRSPFRPAFTSSDMQKAIDLLSERLSEDASEQLFYELFMLRGKARGRLCLSDGSEATEALKDFQSALEIRPKSFEARLEAGHIHVFQKNYEKAKAIYEEALLYASPHEERRLRLRMERLEDVYEERWRVEEIRGVSRDSCVYHLRGPPLEHGFPGSAWHVQVITSSAARDYTPISSWRDYEKGHLKLLVKSYADRDPKSSVSRLFGTLRTVAEAREVALHSYSSLEEQSCWLQISAPQLTIQLPFSSKSLGFIAGGTGIAPVLQMLSECLPGGSLFGSTAHVLYSSRTLQDILALHELNELEEASEGRIEISHTLTSSRDTQGALYFAGAHGHFRDREDVLKPPKRLFRGHIDEEMLRKTMPGPKGSQIVVSGRSSRDFVG